MWALALAAAITLEGEAMGNEAAAPQQSAANPPPSSDPVAKIVGPPESKPGDMVILKTDGSSGKTFRWAVFPKSVQSRYYPVDDGHTVLFASSEPCVVYFVLGVAAGDKLSFASHTLRNGTPGPEPPGPGPEPPGPGPEPPDPSDPYAKLKQVSRAEAAKTPQAKRQQVAAALVQATESTASAIAAGGFANMEQARQGWRARCRAGVYASTGDYKHVLDWSQWAIAVGVELKRLDQQQTFDTNRYAAALRAVAESLQGVQ